MFFPTSRSGLIPEKVVESSSFLVPYRGFGLGDVATQAASLGWIRRSWNHSAAFASDGCLW